MSRSTANWLFVTPVIITALLLAKPTLTGNSEFTDEVVDVIGFALVALGMIIRIVSREWKAIHLKGGLVTSGPYAIVRHPMYIGSLISGLGLCTVMGSLLFAAVFVIAYTFTHRSISFAEERFLVKQWPDQFKAYKSNVPAFFPNPVKLPRLIAAEKPWKTLTRNAVKRELGTICGFSVAALLLEVREDFVVEGWKHAHTEISSWLGVVLAICIVWGAHSILRERNCRAASA